MELERGVISFPLANSGEGEDIFREGRSVPGREFESSSEEVCGAEWDGPKGDC